MIQFPEEGGVKLLERLDAHVRYGELQVASVNRDLTTRSRRGLVGRTARLCHCGYHSRLRCRLPPGHGEGLRRDNLRRALLRGRPADLCDAVCPAGLRDGASDGLDDVAVAN